MPVIGGPLSAFESLLHSFRVDIAITEALRQIMASKRFTFGVNVQTVKIVILNCESQSAIMRFTEQLKSKRRIAEATLNHLEV